MGWGIWALLLNSFSFLFPQRSKRRGETVRDEGMRRGHIEEEVEGERQGRAGRSMRESPEVAVERNSDTSFHLFIHSLVDSCMCPDQGLNPPP